MIKVLQIVVGHRPRCTACHRSSGVTFKITDLDTGAYVWTHIRSRCRRPALAILDKRIALAQWAASQAPKMIKVRP
jgi:hypothetical protein